MMISKPKSYGQAKDPKAQWSLEDLKSGLFLSVTGIENTWNLSQSDIAEVLHRSASTISDWKAKGKIHVSKNPDPNDKVIYEFIEFYDSVSSFFSRTSDQIKWLKTSSKDFKNESPLSLLKKDIKNLYFLREWMDRLAARRT
jgi:hypothetical protein